MNFQTGRQQLLEHYKVLAREWKNLNENWKDQKTTEFNKDYMEALERHMKMSLNAIDELDEIFKQLRMECCP